MKDGPSSAQDGRENDFVQAGGSWGWRGGENGFDNPGVLLLISPGSLIFKVDKFPAMLESFRRDLRSDNRGFIPEASGH